MTSVADARAKKLNDRVFRYLDQLQSNDAEQIEHALKKLEMLEMTLDCLTVTKCGRIVNRMVKDPDLGDRASSLVHKWREIATAESTANKQKVLEQEMNRQLEYPNSSENEIHRLDEISVKSKPTKRSAELNDFETQLMQADFLPKKKKRNASNPQIPDDEDIQRTLLESMPEQGTSNSNFLMVSSISRPSSTTNNNDDVDPYVFKRKQRLRVYAGRRKAQDEVTEVPTLLQICQRFLQEHLDQIEEVGDAPYNILECVFERCSTRQLDAISEKNPKLHVDMDPLWERHVKKAFGDAVTKSKEETWYGCYQRLCEEREERLKMISAKIKRSENALMPVSRTMISEVINPPKMQQRQIRNGIAPTTKVADAYEVSQARRELSNGGSKTTLLKLPGASAIKGSVLARNGSSSKASTPKKGILMTKTLRMLKGNRR